MTKQVRLAVEAHAFASLSELRSASALRPLWATAQVWTCEPRPGERGSPPRRSQTIGRPAELNAALSVGWDEFRIFGSFMWLHVRAGEDAIHARLWRHAAKDAAGLECVQVIDRTFIRTDSARFGATLPKGMQLVLHQYRRDGRPLTWRLALAQAQETQA